MRLYLDIDEAEGAVSRILAEPSRNAQPWTDAEVRAMVARLAGSDGWEALVDGLRTTGAPETSRPAIGKRLDALRSDLGYARMAPALGLFFPPDHPGRPVDPHVRFTGKALAELLAHGWRQEDDDVVIQRRAWTVISRPHPAGGTTRLLTIEYDPEFLGMGMDAFGDAHDDFGRALDYPAFVVPFLAELDAAGENWEPRINSQVMGIANGRLTPDVSIDIKPLDGDAREDPDDRIYTVYVPLDDDPVGAARRTLAELAVFREKLADRRRAVRSAVPRIERAAVVAVAAHASSVDEAMAALAPKPPMVIPADPPVGARRMRGPKDGIRIVPYQLPSPIKDLKASRTTDIVTVDAPAPFRWKGNTLTINVGKTLPETIRISAQGMPVDRLVDDPRMNGAGLVVETIMASGKGGATLRFRMASDPLSIDDARELAARLVRTT